MYPNGHTGLSSSRDSLCHTQNEVKCLLEQTHVFSFSDLPSALFTLYSHNFIFLCTSFYSLLLFRVGRAWCEFLICFLIIFNNSFPLKILPIPFYSSPGLFAFLYILLICPVIWSPCHIIHKLAVLPAQMHGVQQSWTFSLLTQPHVEASCTVKSSDHYYSTSTVCKEAML